MFILYNNYFLPILNLLLKPSINSISLAFYIFIILFPYIVAPNVIDSSPFICAPILDSSSKNSFKISFILGILIPPPINSTCFIWFIFFLAFFKASSTGLVI